MSGDRIIANGVNGLTGEYLLAPLDASEVAALAKASTEDIAVQTRLREMDRAMKERTFGVPLGVHPEKVEEAGWAVVFSTEEGDDVKAALEDLIAHRRQKIGDARTKVLQHRPRQTWSEWLDHYRTAPGNIDPEKVPYYLLLIGGPERIPFSLQYLLDTEYAVGRLDFDDAAGYQRYVASLIAYERSEAPARDPVATFFGTRHVFDGATQLSADSLVTPLATSLQPGGQLARLLSQYSVEQVLGDPATKAALQEILAGSSASRQPSLLFSATHGMGGWPSGHPDQRSRHGALLCQDWPGIGQINASQYLAAADVPADARVHGLVAFLFACFGAGTPQYDAFVHVTGQPTPELAPEAFVSALPKALLSHEEGAALAVIGHIDRAWGYSFVSGGGAQLVPFQNAIGRILLGDPIGHAMTDFNAKYATLSANLASLLEDIGFGDKQIPDTELAGVWTERNDAQNYIVLGDPAAALHTP